MSPTEISRQDETLLLDLQCRAFEYFNTLCNPENGLIPDSSEDGSPASIAAVGFALSAYPVGVERGFISRIEARQRTLAALRFFCESEQSIAPDGTGYKGFYYHFLDMKSGRRAWKCELSTIDTALLLAGVLTVAAYFNDDTSPEREIRERAEILYARADWQWAQNEEAATNDLLRAAVAQAWKPERGFARSRWLGYDEGIILYLLGLGSPSHPLPSESYQSWCSTYRWKTIYGQEYLYAGPLFLHQYAQCWLDLRGLRDAPMREHDLDYFENSRRATFIQREYAIRNPRGFRGYGEYCWGLTASDGPGPCVREIEGKQRKFYGYRARGAPFGADDGTLAPWAVLASLPFAPEIVLPAIRACISGRTASAEFGLSAPYNRTFSDANGGYWSSPRIIGIDEGPVVLMIENFRSGLIWQLIRQCSHLARGLRRAGFTGGWLEDTRS